MVRLGDLFEFKNGRSFKKTEWKQTGLPIIRIQNLNNEDAPFNYFDDEYDSSIEVNSGDLLFSWSGTVGSSFGPHIWHREKGVLNQHIFKLTFKKKMEKRYAFYSLLFITAEIERSVVGAVGLVHVTKKSLNEFQIPLPPIPEQQRIVAILDQAFAHIEKARANAERNLKNARELFDSYLNQVFSQRGEGWEKQKLSQVATIISGGTPKSGVSEYWGNDIRWITPKDMGQLTSMYVSDTGRRISNLGLDKSSAKLIESNSVILSTRAPIGHLAINTEPMSTNQGCRGLTPTHNLDAKYLYYFLLGSVDLLNDLGTGTTFKELSKTALEGVEIPLPSIPEQQYIIASLDKLSMEIQQLEKGYQEKLNSLDELKKSLLQKAFSGELTKTEGHAA